MAQSASLIVRLRNVCDVFGGRTLLLIAALTAALAVIGGTLAVNLAARNSVDRATQHLLEATRISGELRQIYNDVFILFGPAVMDWNLPVLNAVEEGTARFNQRLERLGEVVESGGGETQRALFEELAETRADYLVFWQDEIFAMVRNGDREGAQTLVQSQEFFDAANAFGPPFEALLMAIQAEARIAYDRSNTAQQTALTLLGGGFLVMALLWSVILFDWFRQTYAAWRAQARLAQMNTELEHRVEARTRDLGAALTRAEDAARAKSEFLSAMSHELRTPLNGVLGMAALLERSPLSDSQRGMVEVIGQSGQSLLGLLNDVLDYTKLGAGKLTLRAEPFELAEILERATRKAAPEAEKKGLALSLEIAPQARQVFIGDETRIGQIVGILLSNAIKFTDSGAVGVDADMADGAIRIAVRDTGPGVPPELADRIFDRFSQGDASATRRHGGAGLGLALAQRLAMVMGGEIGLDSTPGEGAAFCVLLPLERWTPTARSADQAPQPDALHPDGPKRSAA